MTTRIIFPQPPRYLEYEEHPPEARSPVSPAERISLDKLADTLKVLGNRSRLNALVLLGGARMSAGGLAEALGVTLAASSQATQKLLAYDLVTVAKEGNQNFYSARSGPVTDAVLALAGVRNP